MILVCGGLADPVTELVCARLGDSSYPYRFLDLATYPVGFRLNWHWQGSFPTGYITSEHWQLDVSEISAVYIRYLETEERIKPVNLPREFVPAFYAECDLGLAALLESLP